jgi:hypothetical protein
VHRRPAPVVTEHTSRTPARGREDGDTTVPGSAGVPAASGTIEG